MIYTYLHTLPLHDARPIYHLGPHLRAIEPGGGRGDKTRHLDDREAAQQLVHAVSLSRLGRKIAQHVLGDLQLEDLRRPFIDAIDRSEEHTSELQSLMRISYAVFCLKK